MVEVDENVLNGIGGKCRVGRYRHTFQSIDVATAERCRYCIDHQAIAGRPNHRVAENERIAGFFDISVIYAAPAVLAVGAADEILAVEGPRVFRIIEDHGIVRGASFRHQ